jgi:hypothetical protein
LPCLIPISLLSAITPITSRHNFAIALEYTVLTT